MVVRASEAVAKAFAERFPILDKEGKPLPMNTLLTKGEWGTDYELAVEKHGQLNPEWVLITHGWAGKAMIYNMAHIRETALKLYVKPPEPLPVAKIVVLSKTQTKPGRRYARKLEYWLYPGGEFPCTRAKDKDGRIHYFRVDGSKLSLLNLPPGEYRLEGFNPYVPGSGVWVGKDVILPAGTRITYSLRSKHNSEQCPAHFKLTKL